MDVKELFQLISAISGVASLFWLMWNVKLHMDSKYPKIIAYPRINRNGFIIIHIDNVGDSNAYDVEICYANPDNLSFKNALGPLNNVTAIMYPGQRYSCRFATAIELNNSLIELKNTSSLNNSLLRFNYSFHDKVGIRTNKSFTIDLKSLMSFQYENYTNESIIASSLENIASGMDKLVKEIKR